MSQAQGDSATMPVVVQPVSTHSSARARSWSEAGRSGVDEGHGALWPVDVAGEGGTATATADG